MFQFLLCLLLIFDLFEPQQHCECLVECKKTLK